MRGCVLCWLLLLSPAATADQLSIVPANPTPLDLVRLQYTHVGCTNPDSVQIAQQADRITVQADRTFAVDCGTTNGFYEEFTLGRLPTGDYDAELVVNPPPPTLGPSFLLGPVHFTVASLPATGENHPHENYSDVWWNPQESGWALTVSQSGDKLFAVWFVYDSGGRPSWYFLSSGSWSRDSNNALHYSGPVYKSSGPYWAGAFDPARVTINAVGTADFLPQGTGRALFSYSVEGVSGAKQIERFRF